MARDSQRWGKDRRDRHPHDHRPGARAVANIGGIHGIVAAVREERGRGGVVRSIITEERFNIPMPPAIDDRVRGIFVKVNWERAPHEPTPGRCRSRVLVIAFRNPQGGIVGLPVRRAEANKLRKCGYTHVTITWLAEDARDAAAGQRPRGYDERAFRIAWYKPRGGHWQEGEKGGEIVHAVHDELSVLEWLTRHNLLALYDIPELRVQGFLPLRDEDRSAANMRMLAPGHVPHPPNTFHAERLLRRIASLTDAETHD